MDAFSGGEIIFGDKEISIRTASTSLFYTDNLYGRQISFIGLGMLFWPIISEALFVADMILSEVGTDVLKSIISYFISHAIISDRWRIMVKIGCDLRQASRANL